MSALDVNHFWQFALLAVPLAAVVAATCRFLPCRPATRHLLWLTLLVLLLVAPLLPRSPAPDLTSLLAVAGPTDAPTSEPQAPSLAEPSGSELMDRVPALRRTTAASGIQEPAAAGAPLPTPAVKAQQPQAVTDEATGRPTPSASRQEERQKEATPAAVKLPVRHGTDLATPRGQPSAPGLVQNPVGHRPRRSKASEPASVDPALAPSAPAPERTAALAPPEKKAKLTEPSSWARWALSLGSIRDEVLRLPPLPTAVWGAGSALFLLLITARLLRFRCHLRAAIPAPREAEATVLRVAAEMGLRSVPTVLMVNARISPMVSCGRTLRLLLPSGLWSQLDEVARQAVVSHELAHLKRRDHWVCWLALIVGCLYWWHPIVWFIQRRLRDEADLCCDVWVTTLMPTARRAYATALLETRRFTAPNRSPNPSAALCLSTIHARCFARRLTMVMSQQIKPHLTLGGLLLAGTLIAGTWLATPTFAGDAKPLAKAQQTEPQEPATLRAAELAEVLAAVSVSEEDEAAATTCASGAAGSTWAADDTGEAECEDAQLASFLVVGVGADPSCDLSLEERLTALERKLELLTRKLAGQAGLPGAPATPLPPRGTGITIVGEAPHAVHAVPAIKTLGGAGLAQYTAGGVVQKVYVLPEGKLGALTELMSRSDVPIVVSPAEDSITVHGTTAQHLVFEAFVDMINGDDEVVAHELPPGKLEALTELMLRADVPILVSPIDGAIKVHGTTLEQAVFRAFVEMIDGDTPPATLGYTYLRRPTVSPDERWTLPRIEQYEIMAAEQVGELEALRGTLETVLAQVALRVHEAGLLEQQAEELELKADQAEELAEALEMKAEELEGDARISLIQRFNELLLKARQLENEARVTQARAEAQESLADRLETEADNIEERIDELTEVIEEALWRDD